MHRKEHILIQSVRVHNSSRVVVILNNMSVQLESFFFVLKFCTPKSQVTGWNKISNVQTF